MGSWEGLISLNPFRFHITRASVIIFHLASALQLYPSPYIRWEAVWMILRFTKWSLTHMVSQDKLKIIWNQLWSRILTQPLPSTPGLRPLPPASPRPRPRFGGFAAPPVGAIAGSSHLRPLWARGRWPSKGFQSLPGADQTRLPFFSTVTAKTQTDNVFQKQ